MMSKIYRNSFGERVFEKIPETEEEKRIVEEEQMDITSLSAKIVNDCRDSGLRFELVKRAIDTAEKRMRSAINERRKELDDAIQSKPIGYFLEKEDKV